MIVLFGSFALGSTLVIKELGVGLAAAVFLDSTIVRVVLVPASMKLFGAGNWWMPKFLDWIPQIKESSEPEEPHPTHQQLGADRAAVPQALVMSCARCGASMRPGARFCGRCGTSSAAMAPQMQMPGAAGETISVPAGIPAARRAVSSPAVADGFAPHRVPILLQLGQQRIRAWLVLRDCQVESSGGRAEVPSLELRGVEMSALHGPEPEIQIRNARIRL